MIYLETRTFKSTDLEDVLSALCSLAEEINADFTGENGSEFVSDIALKSGFDSDMDYICNFIRERDTGEMDWAINTFLSELFQDASYYESWTYETLEDVNGKDVGIAVAWTLR